MSSSNTLFGQFSVLLRKLQNVENCNKQTEYQWTNKLTDGPAQWQSSSPRLKTVNQHALPLKIPELVHRVSEPVLLWFPDWARQRPNLFAWYFWPMILMALSQGHAFFHNHPHYLQLGISSKFSPHHLLLLFSKEKETGPKFFHLLLGKIAQNQESSHPLAV